MQRSVFKRSGRVVITIVRWLLVVCLVAVTVSALSNLGLPTRSQVVDRLSDAEKARLAEMFHLREIFGDVVWPGWSKADIPVIVYNEAYAFLIGYPDPPPGWFKMPQRIARGRAWEVVPDDIFVGQSYFRQRLADPNVTPESFTVLVGDRWLRRSRQRNTRRSTLCAASARSCHRSCALSSRIGWPGAGYWVRARPTSGHLSTKPSTPTRGRSPPRALPTPRRPCSRTPSTTGTIVRSALRGNKR